MVFGPPALFFGRGASTLRQGRRAAAGPILQRGLARALQVAAIAQAAGKQIAPHSPTADPLIGPFWQFAAICPNLFGLQEFVYTDEAEPSWYTPKITVRDGRMTIPATPGMGIAYDEGIWARAERVL